MELYSTKSILNLGTGVGTDAQFTDTDYASTETNSNYKTIVVSGEGKIEEAEPSGTFRYTCAYPLVR